MTKDHRDTFERAIAALTEEQHKDKRMLEELRRRSAELDREIAEIQERIRKVRAKDQE